jgi:hypothetical protein
MQRLRPDSPPDACYFCSLDLAQVQSFGQLHLPPLSHEQFIRPHAEHFMRASFTPTLCNSGANLSGDDASSVVEVAIHRGQIEDPVSDDQAREASTAEVD